MKTFKFGENWITPKEIAAILSIFHADGSPDYNGLYNHLKKMVHDGKIEKKNIGRHTFYRRKQDDQEEKAKALGSDG